MGIQNFKSEFIIQISAILKFTEKIQKLVAFYVNDDYEKSIKTIKRTCIICMCA